MSEKIRYEVQIETPKTRHGGLAVGGRDGYVDLSNEDRVVTLTRTVEKARESIKKLEADDRDNWLKRDYRIVKITVTTTYEIVE